MQADNPLHQSSDLILRKLIKIEAKLDELSKPQALPNDTYLTPKELCEKYKLNRGTLEKFFNCGLIEKIKIGPKKVLISEKEIQKILNKKAS